MHHDYINESYSMCVKQLIIDCLANLKAIDSSLSNNRDIQQLQAIVNSSFNLNNILPFSSSNNKNTNNIHDLSFNDQDDNEYDYEIERNGKKYNRLLNNNRQNNNNTKTIDNLTKEERFKRYQKFYLHYGACCLVWFIYLPILIFITSFVSELYRLRLVLSIRYFVNFISVVILFYIMWSPKTPLKLPGKKLPTKYELINLQYLLDTESNEAADGDEDVLYVNEGHTNSDK